MTAPSSLSRLGREAGRTPTFPTITVLLQRLQGVSPYLVAGVALLVALAARFLLNLTIGPLFRYTTFYIAVVLCSILGGARVGALVTILGFLFANYFVGDHSLIPVKQDDILMGLIYVLNCVIVILLTTAQRSTQEALLDHASALEAETLERRQIEQERERALREIEALNARLRRAVQETHHRVKNNLQVIAALAEMEALSNDQVPVSVLHRIGQHVRMLAMIHDLLTLQTRELANGDDRIPIERVMERLLPLVRSTIGERQVTSETDAFSITAREGGAIALLINELVSNAVKHGGSEIGIRLTCTDKIITLTVSDDGPGFPVGFDPERAAHTGLELVESAARWDLQGELRFENRPEGGAQVVIRFPLSEH